jgi:ureidoglycolate lyase
MSAPRPLTIQPLTPEAFAPFGDVIDTAGADSYPINEGTALRFNDLARIDVTAQGGRPGVSVFRGQAMRFPLELSDMERHPLGSQAFMPLSGRPFLVVVAPDIGGKPGEPRAFLSNGRQGINFHRNTWHHSLLTLGETSDFLVVDRLGLDDNCEVAALPGRFGIPVSPA